MAKRKRATEGRVYDKSESPKAYDPDWSDDDLKAYQTRPGRNEGYTDLAGYHPPIFTKKDVNLPLAGASWEVRKRVPHQADYSQMTTEERRKRAGHGSRIMRD